MGNDCLTNPLILLLTINIKFYYACFYCFRKTNYGEEGLQARQILLWKSLMPQLALTKDFGMKILRYVYCNNHDKR